MGSVEGVNTAPAIAEAITTTLHADSIFCHVISLIVGLAIEKLSQ